MSDQLVRQLEAMLGVHDRHGSRLRAARRPGHTADHVLAILGGHTGVIHRADLVGFYTWCDGTELMDGTATLPIAPGSWILTLQDADGIYREQEELHRRTAEMFGDDSLGWPSSWWPLLGIVGAGFVVTDSTDGSVWRCEAGDTDGATRLFDSLADLFTAINWATEEQYFVPTRTESGWPVMEGRIPEVEPFEWLATAWRHQQR